MELWKAIDGWPLYEVSDLGNVRSVDRTVFVKDGRVRRQPGKQLQPNIAGNGYPMVTLYRQNGEVRREVCVHQLVAEAFIGPRPDLSMEIRHLNGDKLNPALENIEYATQRRNKQDVKWHDGCRKDVLTPQQVQQIKRQQLHPYHGQGRALARQYGVSDSLISAIKHGGCHEDVSTW